MRNTGGDAAMPFWAVFLLFFFDICHQQTARTPMTPIILEAAGDRSRVRIPVPVLAANITI